MRGGVAIVDRALCRQLNKRTLLLTLTRACGNRWITEIQFKQGNHWYQTSPALCNPTTPFAADRPHCFRPEILRILLTLAWYTEWSLPLHDVIGDWMIPFIATLQRPVQWRLSMLLNGSDNPRKLPLPLGASAPPSKIWFHGPTRVFTQNGMSAVFLHSALQSVPYYFTMGRYVFPPNIAPSRWGIGSPSNTPRAHPSCQPKWHLDRFSRFCMGPKCYVV